MIPETLNYFTEYADVKRVVIVGSHNFLEVERIGRALDCFPSLKLIALGARTPFDSMVEGIAIRRQLTVMRPEKKEKNRIGHLIQTGENIVRSAHPDAVITFPGARLVKETVIAAAQRDIAIYVAESLDK